MGGGRLRIYVFLALCLLTLVNVGSVWYFSSHEQSCLRAENEFAKRDVSLIYPFNQGLDNTDFVNVQRMYTTNHFDLKLRINATLVGPNQTFGYYFESLNTGSWVGINERTKYLPLSLWKLPLLAAAIKEMEDGKLSANTRVTILPDDVDVSFGTLGVDSVNKTFSVLELMRFITHDSDNTAMWSLLRTVGPAEYGNAMIRLGLPITSFVDFTPGKYPLSAKEYSNILRSLYYSSYLQRDNSRELLLMLTNTSFSDGIPAGVPADVLVAHKIGFMLVGEENQHHDCGIVYYPRSPYILCIMTSGMTYEESNAFIKNLSRITYEHMDAVMRGDSSQ